MSLTVHMKRLPATSTPTWFHQPGLFCGDVRYSANPVDRPASLPASTLAAAWSKLVWVGSMSTLSRVVDPSVPQLFSGFWSHASFSA